MRLNGWVIGAALFAVSGCGGGGSSGPSEELRNTPPPPGGIAVLANQFSPVTKTVDAGTTVEWGWSTCSGGGGDGYGGGSSQTCIAHNVTFADGAASPTQQTGTYARTFNSPATYDYRCTLHPTTMNGSIIVVAP